MAWLLLGSPWNSQAVFYLFQNIYSVQSMFVLPVTVNVFGTDIKCLVAHAQWLPTYQLLFTPAPTTNNLVISIIQSGHWTQEKFILTFVAQEQGITSSLY
jgi:hypothetical protein